VIALAAREAPSLSERRRVTSLTQQHARTWLGPLAALVDVEHSRFEGGFLADLVCQSSAPLEAWAQLTGEPRLATVVSLSVLAGTEPPVFAAFVRHPVLRHLARLYASAKGWALLGPAPLPLEVVSLGSWGVFDGELEVVRGRRARCLELETSEFVNPLVAAEVREAVLLQRSALSGFEALCLVVRYGVVEGAAAWLLGAQRDDFAAHWQERAFGVEYGESRFTLTWSGSGLHALSVDLEHKGDVSGLGQRIATAASVLVQLGPARLESVEITLPKGARVRPAERDALRAAARRLGSVKTFSLGGAALAP
jgi:hypothetical protein